MGLEKSGLAASLVQAIPFIQWPPMLTAVGATPCLLMANFMTILPVPNLPPWWPLSFLLILLVGGSMGLILSVTFAASLDASSARPIARLLPAANVDTVIWRCK